MTGLALVAIARDEAGAGRSAARYLLYQLGKDYEAYEDDISAAERFREALRLTDVVFAARVNHALKNSGSDKLDKVNGFLRS